MPGHHLGRRGAADGRVRAVVVARVAPAFGSNERAGLAAAAVLGAGYGPSRGANPAGHESRERARGLGRLQRVVAQGGRGGLPALLPDRGRGWPGRAPGPRRIPDLGSVGVSRGLWSDPPGGEFGAWSRRSQGKPTTTARTYRKLFTAQNLAFARARSIYLSLFPACLDPILFNGCRKRISRGFPLGRGMLRSRVFCGTWARVVSAW
mmetsp:Transcript_45321/g.102369  ORF Transcript_45321/g.102369 Transcript_45321/m.102369 type:complete len:207 (-) Transcript_45321:525-1145(-)